MGRPNLPLKGACLCGAVQIRISARALLTVACHCRDCQKMTAGAYSLGVIFPSDGFSCTGELVRGGRGAGLRTHQFCKTCLSLVFTRIEGADHRINLRTSMLDHAASFPPFVELMTEEKLPWVNVPVAHSFARYPQDAKALQALTDDYARREPEWNGPCTGNVSD